MSSDSGKLLEEAGELLLQRQGIVEYGEYLHSMIERLTTGDLMEFSEEIKASFIQILTASIQVNEGALRCLSAVSRSFEIHEQVMALIVELDAQVEDLSRQVEDRNRGDEWREQ